MEREEEENRKAKGSTCTDKSAKLAGRLDRRYVGAEIKETTGLIGAPNLWILSNPYNLG